MGLGTTPARQSAWFSRFRQRLDDGALDIVCVQETRVTENDVADAARRHLRTWGFVEDGAQRFSLWSPSAGRSAGVAILLDPYSRITALRALRALRKQEWGPHWIAATATLDGHGFTIISVYRPTSRAEREVLFALLESVVSDARGPVFLCGDFNSTLLAARDRSYQSRWNSHDSPALRQLLLHGRLSDVLDDDDETAGTELDIADWRMRRHTYFYKMSSGREASSRLDRWYCASGHGDWVRAVCTTIPGPFSDHNGVAIRVAAPGRAVQVKSRRQVHPPPRYAASAAKAVTAGFFANAPAELESAIANGTTTADRARAAATWWDNAKQGLCNRYLAATRENRQKATTGYRQRLKRLADRLTQVASNTNAAPEEAQGERPVDSVLDARRAVVECKAEWQLSKRRALLRSHVHHPARSQRAFYRRVSNKFLDNTVLNLGGTARYGRTRSQGLAEDMRDGWQEVMQQQSPNSSKIADFLGSLPSRPTRAGLEMLCMKSWGPDELGNDWYRGNEELIVPLLVRLFNVCRQGNVLPSTFGEANVSCIKKSKSAARPLDYRPISLLNSDYKIFTRVFASRLRPMLPRLVHPMQTGFVPHREMATIIDVYAAAKICARENPELRQAFVLLLDFSKAYDSLARDFLLAALQRFGFPDEFVRIAGALHNGTRSRFVVNGYTSRSLEVTCGIRQGCPLAPLLFILAPEPLYKLIESTHAHQGVILANGSASMTVKVGGYADDTAVYFKSPDAVAEIVRALMRFGAVSGLMISAFKLMAVPLHEGADIDPERLHGVELLRDGERCRCLGVLVGTGSTVEDNWEACFAVLNSRLALARRKTNAVRSRAALAAAIVVPKVAFLALHSWPTRGTANDLQKMAKRFVWGMQEGAPVRAWMSEKQAELRVSDGGLSVPHVATDLLTMAATAVGKWAAGANGPTRVAGDILLARRAGVDVYLTPARLEAPRYGHTISDTMWNSGAAVVRGVHSDPIDPTDAGFVSAMETLLRRHLHEASWDGDRMRFTVEEDTMLSLARLSRG